MISSPHLLRYLPWLGLIHLGCGPTEVIIGDAPGLVRTVAGVPGVRLGLGEFQSDGQPSSDALQHPLGAPTGLAAREDGSFYFADRNLRRVGFVGPEGEITWPVGRGTCPFQSDGGGNPVQACLFGPVGLAFDAEGRLLIGDADGHRVYRFDPEAETLELVLGTRSPGLATDGALAVNSPTNEPFGLLVTPDGAILVAERLNHRIIQISTDGRITSVAGTGELGDAGDGGAARDARLSRPEGIALTGTDLYIGDTGNNRIRRVREGQIQAYSGLGAAGFAGDGQSVELALYREPSHLAIVGEILLVSDRGNRRVRGLRLGPDSVITLAGNGDSEVSSDLLEAGRTGIAEPTGIAVAGRAIFIADAGHAVVRRLIR